MRDLSQGEMMSNSRKKSYLTKKQFNELNDQVQAERERIQNKLNLEPAHVAINQSDSGRDEVDSANDDILRRQALRFATRESLYLKKLVKTLDLMQSPDYGLCNDCGESISFTRLKARPTSTMCIGCKEESERDELQNYNGRTSKSLGKSVEFR